MERAMSVYSMAQSAEDGAEAKNYLVALKDYIPAEALAIYLFAVGILSPAADATKTDIAALKVFCFVIGLLAVTVITLRTFKSEKSTGNGFLSVSEPNRRRLVLILLAWSAFAAYILVSLVPTGYELASVELARYAVVIAAIWALIVPAVADQLGVRKMG
jgi:hypothetical protein